MTNTKRKPAATQALRQTSNADTRRAAPKTANSRATPAKTNANIAPDATPMAAPWEIHAGDFTVPDWLSDQLAAKMPWAPRTLVNEFMLYLLTATATGSFARRCFEYPDAEQAMLGRLLTHKDMAKVWPQIEKTCVAHSVSFTALSRRLWREIVTAHAVVKETCRTGMEITVELEAIAKSLRETIKKIERQRVAKILSRRATHELTARQLTQNIPSADHPLHDQVRMEAQITDDVLSVLADRSCGRETRLAEALSAAVSLSLVDVAGHFADQLAWQASVWDSQVKRTRKDGANAVYIRRVRQVFRETFGKDMQTIGAQILNVALGNTADVGVTPDLFRKTKE